MIKEEDVELICLTDDIDYVASEIETSLYNQLSELKGEGLEQTKYYKAITEYFVNRNINDSKDSQ
jgi:hypothetical protein